MAITLDKMMKSKSIDLVSTSGIIVKISKTVTAPLKFKVTKVNNGIHMSVHRTWESVETELASLTKLHGELVEYDTDPKDNKKLDALKEQAAEIADKIIKYHTVAKKLDKSLLTDVMVQVNYIRKYKNKGNIPEELIAMAVQEKLK